MVNSQAITARALDQYYHLEEDCLVKKADVSKLLQRIQVCLLLYQHVRVCADSHVR